MSMSATAPTADYRSARQLSPQERAIAWALVALVHGVVIGGMALASLKQEAPTPTPSIMVSMIAEEQAAPVAPPEPPPPQPVQPTPQPKVLASPRPTPSPMTAPPPDEPVRVSPPQPSAAPATPSAAPSAPAQAQAATTPPNYTAAYLNNPAPQYPYASRRKREQGVVRLKVFVGANGRAEQVQIERSSGFAELDAAARDVIKSRWRFAPAKQGDKAVSAWVVVPLEFELKDR